jgi:hypothetical protein
MATFYGRYTSVEPRTTTSMPIPGGDNDARREHGGRGAKQKASVSDLRIVTDQSEVTYRTESAAATEIRHTGHSSSPIPRSLSRRYTISSTPATTGIRKSRTRIGRSPGLSSTAAKQQLRDISFGAVTQPWSTARRFKSGDDRTGRRHREAGAG